MIGLLESKARYLQTFSFGCQYTVINTQTNSLWWLPNIIDVGKVWSQLSIRCDHSLWIKHDQNSLSVASTTKQQLE